MDLRELEETAALAHMNVRRDELAAALPAFEQMLGFFAAMSAADREAFTQTSGAARALNAGQIAGAFLARAGDFRSDTETGGELPAADAARLIDAAGERDGRFIVIPNVL
jgi:aspartyl-tRNA(Asn)/glutamyl-tRNA(Gln) amidotransferase subunit C